MEKRTSAARMRGLMAVTLLALTTSLCAKSLVLQLTNGTKVYYKITTAEPPRMVMEDDGTFSVNAREYSFSSVKSFTISDTDYSGEKGTTDGIVSIDERGIDLKGEVSVYTLDGKLVKRGVGTTDLPRGIYVISNGVSTLKIQKR